MGGNKNLGMDAAQTEKMVDLSRKITEMTHATLTSKPKELLTIEEIVNDPIISGFFLRFSEESFCAENMRFWLAVDQFKDKCEKMNFQNAQDVAKCKELADAIWKEYLCENSDTEVSLPSTDRRHTIDRLQNIHDYYVTVFDVAITDPLNTLRRDIRPRFVNSSLFTDVTNLTSPSPANDVFAISPPSTTLNELRVDTNKDEFTLKEIVQDKFLYAAMLNNLQKRFSAENLLVFRAIEQFEETILSKEERQKLAWNIYRQFVAPNSYHEVSASTLVRKTVMQHLANPTTDMFAEVKEGALRVLQQDYKEFRGSEEYRQAVKQVRTKSKKGGNIMSKLMHKITA